MDNYYFTFGQAHIDSKGKFLKDNWIRVVELNYTTARIKFQKWAKTGLAHPDYWAFQYTEIDFNKHFYPKGELLVL